MRILNRTRAPFFVAALLISGSLAACADTPTGASIAADEPAALNTAPQPTVSDSAGHPLISWPAVPGATSYTVRYSFLWVTHMADGTEYDHGETIYPVGTTTGTSVVDSVLSYTGNVQCWFPDPYGTHFEILTYFYSVTAHFPGGTATAYVFAPVGPC